MIECVVNVSEGRDLAVIEEIARVASSSLLDVHSDPHHNRSVFTLAGPLVEEAVRSVARLVVELVDIRGHEGVHPRIGSLDVVPFVHIAVSAAAQGPAQGPAEAPEARTEGWETVPLPAEVLRARSSFADWAGTELGLPCFLYGPERSLPDVRRRAFDLLAPDHGPPLPHPTAGGCAVGARPALVAYNLWLSSSDVTLARRIAAAIRSPNVRALGLEAGGQVQVSCNLLDPMGAGPARVADQVAQMAGGAGVALDRAELVGLVPRAVLHAQPRSRWEELDLSEERTIEHRACQIYEAEGADR